jgi:hypothetical protein
MAVTPSLFVGEPGDEVFFTDLYWADTVGQAVTLINDGLSALLAYDNWQAKARVILAQLGARQGHISWLIATAPRVNENQDARWPDTVPVDF